MTEEWDCEDTCADVQCPCECCKTGCDCPCGRFDWKWEELKHGDFGRSPWFDHPKYLLAIRLVLFTWCLIFLFLAWAEAPNYPEINCDHFTDNYGTNGTCRYEREGDSEDPCPKFGKCLTCVSYTDCQWCANDGLGTDDENCQWQSTTGIDGGGYMWTWFVYLTDTSYCWVVWYLGTAVYFSIKAVRKHGSPSKRTTPTCFEYYSWTVFSIAISAAWVVFLLYWLILQLLAGCFFGEPCKYTAVAVHAHGVNIVWMLIEFVFNDLPVVWTHIVFPFAYGFVYLAFAMIWYGATNYWVYWVMDPENPVGLWLTLVVYPVALGSLGLAMCCTYLCYAKCGSCCGASCCADARMMRDAAGELSSEHTSTTAGRGGGGSESESGRGEGGKRGKRGSSSYSGAESDPTTSSVSENVDVESGSYS